MSPVQVKVLPMTNNNTDSAVKFKNELLNHGIRVEIDDRDIPISRKVRDAQLQKINYMVTIGDKEQESNTLAVRTREGKVEFKVNPRDFIQNLKKEIEWRI